MEMLSKCQFSLFALICILIFSTKTVNASYCSLNEMRDYAREACLHLFQDEPREKRSASFEDNLIDDDSYYSNKGYNVKRHFISRSNFPAGGYLKVTAEHFIKLREANVHPKYKLKKMHPSKYGRVKRSSRSELVNLPYCCYGNCKDDFFCF